MLNIGRGWLVPVTMLNIEPSVLRKKSAGNPHFWSRKYVLRIPGFSWLPKGWKGVRMRNQKLHNIRPRGAFCPEVRFSRAFFLVQKFGGDLYDVRVLFLAWESLRKNIGYLVEILGVLHNI
jgi:hypothetical protein